MLACLFCNSSELMFVVTADNLIDGVEYKDAILRAKELAKEGNITAIGIKPVDVWIALYHYVLRDGEDVVRFIEKIKVGGNAKSGDDAGIFVEQRNVYIQSWRHVKCYQDMCCGFI